MKKFLPTMLLALMISGCENLPDLGSINLAGSNSTPVETGATSTDVDLGALGIDVQNTSENQLCMQAVSYACSQAHLGIQAPYCTVAHANNCGVIPKNAGDSADLCFTNKGLGLLDEKNSPCRFTAIDGGIKIAPTSYRVPVGPPSVYDQQQEMVTYKYANVIGKYYLLANWGFINCPNSNSGPSLACLRSEMRKHFVSAQGQQCDMNFTEHFQANRSINTSWGDLLATRCSVKKEELEQRFAEQLKQWRRAYAWRSEE